MIGNYDDIIKFMKNSDKNLFEIKEYHDKRSLTANSYYQTLLTQLSQFMGISRQELHIKYVKENSPCLLVPLPIGQSPKNYFRYYEYYKNAEINGKEASYFKVYKGTSEMDSKEFSVVLNSVVEDCRAVGIQVLDDERIKNLKYE